MSSSQGGAASDAADLKAAFQFKPGSTSPNATPLPTGLPEVPFDLALSLTPDLLLQPSLSADLSQLTSANLAGLTLPLSLDVGSSSPGGTSQHAGSSSKRRRATTQRSCQFPGCGRFAHGPQFTHCLRHGGGYRCQFPGCTKSAYSTKFCSRHGGGPRCQIPGGCAKGAISNSSFCRRHGGGKRCAHPSCTQGARQGFNYCLGHGGYNPCVFPSCPLPALHSSSYCRQHNSYQKKIANSQVLALNHGLFGVDDFSSVLAANPAVAALASAGGLPTDQQHQQHGGLLLLQQDSHHLQPHSPTNNQQRQ